MENSNNKQLVLDFLLLISKRLLAQIKLKSNLKVYKIQNSRAVSELQT